jgi:hypothetical protein
MEQTLTQHICWQIELLFKKLKNHNTVKKVVTRQPLLVEGVIWAIRLSLPIKRYIGRVAQWQKTVRFAKN